MALAVTGSSGLGVSQGNGGSLQGSSPILQGGAVKIQGSSPSLQGTPIQIQGSNTPGISLGNAAQSGAFVNNAQNQFDAQNKQIAALLASLNARPAPVYGKVLDTNAYYNQATTAATNASNPYYSKLLNDFVTQQSTAKQQQQQQTTFNIQNLQDQLAQNLQANAVTGTRATQDAATSEANAAQATDNRQTDQGTQFNTDRNALAVKQATAGLTGSGLAAGAQATAQQTQDTNEARQAQADQATKDATELTKARTFEDLATSGTLATSAEAKGETQANFDLNKFITAQSGDLQNEQQQLQQQQKAQILQDATARTKVLVQNAINSIANPSVRAATIQNYGSYL